MNEVKFGVIGGVDAGKSSLIGVLSYDILDDGRGLARNKVLKLPHEKECGRTSSVSKHFVKKTNEERFTTFLDLAGHEKYLKTTLYGLSGFFLDYAIIIVGANMGVTKMTKEHLGIILPLRIPFIVVVTKIDIAPPDILKKTLEDIQYIIRKKRSPQRETRLMNTSDDINEMLEVFNENKYKICPIFQVSNTQGTNLNLLKSFVFPLPSRFEEQFERLKIANPSCIDKNVFKIHEKFNVKGVGLVVSGFTKYGQIKPGIKMYLGPIYGDWKEVIVKSIHNNFRELVPQLNTGESGCLSIKFTDKKFKVPKKSIRKGAVVTDHPQLSNKFQSDVYILSSQYTTIRKNYQPVMNCNTIVQGAKIYDLEKETIRGGEKVWVKFEFMYRPEYIEIGDLFIFREGNIKGFGKVTQIIE